MPTEAERLAELLAGMMAEEGFAVPAANRDEQWDAPTAEAERIATRLLAAGVGFPASERVAALETALFPHRGGWRHAMWCDWERGSETDCTCGLDALRRALVNAAALEPAPADTLPKEATE